MTSMLIPVLLLTVVVLFFGALMLFLTSRIGPKVKASEKKLMPYECGIVGEENESTKVPVKYYLVAILFILFDIEIVYMYPWALVYNDYLKWSGAYILIEMFVFMLILIIGLFYVWRAKGLEWE